MGRVVIRYSTFHPELAATTVDFASIQIPERPLVFARRSRDCGLPLGSQSLGWLAEGRFFPEKAASGSDTSASIRFGRPVVFGDHDS
jgi:hypothetical protein